MRRACLILALLAAQLVFVHSHTYLSALTIDGVELQEGDCLRPYRNFEKENPIASILSPDMTCGFLPWAGQPANRKCPVRAGSTISMQWHHNNNGPSDDIIAPTHIGPCMVYMAKSDTGAGAVWFKVFEDGFNPSTRKWCVDTLLENKGVFSFVVPSDISPGNYLIRGEIIALHNGYAVDGSQPYVLCAEVTVSGSGSANPAGVTIPGAYSLTDPGIRFDIYQQYNNYIIPGPRPYVPQTSGTPAPTRRPGAPTFIPTVPPTQKPVDPTAQPTQASTPKPPVQGATGAPISGSSNIKLSVHPSSSVYWVAIAINAGSSAGISRVELQDYNMASYGECANTTYGYWEFHPSAPLAMPITIRVTSDKGVRAILSNVITSITSFAQIDSGTSFGGFSDPPATVSPTTRPYQPATQQPATQPPSTQAPTAPAATFPPVLPPVNNQETVHLSLHSGASIWWLAVAVMNGEASKVEFKDTSSSALASWTAMVNNPTWGYWTFGTQGTSITTPVTIRATSASGKVATVTFNTLDLTSPVDTNVAF